VGAGAGLKYPKVAVVPLKDGPSNGATRTNTDDSLELTISEAKRRLAKSLGVPEASIKITVEA
jgi:hypothetical protein